MPEYETVDVLRVRVVTEKAFKFVFVSDLSEKWVPRSVVEEPDEIEHGDTDIEVNIAAWFCRKEEIE